jgi:hypothetical protein
MFAAVLACSAAFGAATSLNIAHACREKADCAREYNPILARVYTDLARDHLGFVLIIIHNCCALGECWLQNGELKGAAIVLAPIVGITMLLGFILLGIGSWQANKIPRWAIVLWITGV